MAELPAAAIAALFKPLFEAWSRRGESKAASDAGSLMFWRDGMLRQLEAIADGSATEKTFEQLKSEFENTSQPMAVVVERLRDAREKLAGSNVAKQIDVILFDEDHGKVTIRAEIGELLEKYEKQGVSTAENRRDLVNLATQACFKIGTLNGQIEALTRLVSPR